MSQHPFALTVEARIGRVVAMNAVLSSHGLKPLQGRLGQSDQGEIEFTHIVEVLDHNGRFYKDVIFGCIFPNGAQGTYPQRYNANSGTLEGEARSDGAVAVVLINGQVAMTRQFRPGLGVEITELPRGFAEALDAASIAGCTGQIRIADLRLGVVDREVGEEIMKGAIGTATYLGSVAENSSTHAVAPDYYLVTFEVDQEALEARLATRNDEGIRLKLMTFDTAMRQVGRQIHDAHSIVGLTLAAGHIADMAAVRG